LYIAQGRSAKVNWQWSQTDQIHTPVSTNLGVFSLTVLDVSQLPALTISGHEQFSTAADLGGNPQALWPTPSLLVWKPSGYGWPSRYDWPYWGVLPLQGWDLAYRMPPFIGAGGPAQVTGWLGTGGSLAISVFALWFSVSGPGEFIAFD